MIDDDEVADRAAERWLIDQHAADWYIGTATAEEWADAYASTKTAVPDA